MPFKAIHWFRWSLTFLVVSFKASSHIFSRKPATTTCCEPHTHKQVKKLDEAKAVPLSQNQALIGQAHEPKYWNGSCGAVAQSVERPSKVPVWCSSIDWRGFKLRPETCHQITPRHEVIFFKYGPFPASFWGIFIFLSLIHWYDTIDIYTFIW